VDKASGEISAVAPGQHIPVLLYHSVASSPAPEIAGYCVSEQDFSAQIAAVAQSGREAVSLTELAARLAGSNAAGTSNLVCVTFDDGWRDNIAAAETLDAAGVPATVYVTSGYVGSEHMVSESELRELADAPGIEIGAHSVTHPHLDEISAAAARSEIADSKSAIEQMIGRAIESFAYPHGAYDRIVREAVIEAGFTSAAAVKNALSHPADDRFAIARWTITDKTDASELAAILDGTGAPLAWRNERLRTRGYRQVRRARHRLSGRRH
jgi:peptidoglycan/xylan/chitin deacetylase (PgdA/CDA1 family)